MLRSMPKAPAPTGSGNTLTEWPRAGLLTPYFAETLADDVLRAGPGGGIEIFVHESVDAATRDRVHDAFAWIANRGVDVVVRGTRPRHPHSSAA